MPFGAAMRAIRSDAPQETDARTVPRQTFAGHRPSVQSTMPSAGSGELADERLRMMVRLPRRTPDRNRRHADRERTL